MSEQPATQALIGIANSGAAAWINRFVVVRTPTMLRIAFVEQAPDGELCSFRSAVAMSYQDAAALQNLLTSILIEAGQITVQ